MAATGTSDPQMGTLPLMNGGVVGCGLMGGGTAQFKRMVMAGHLGRKSGKGFYEYAPA